MPCFNKAELARALMDFIKRISSGDVRNTEESKAFPIIANILVDICNDTHANTHAIEIPCHAECEHLIGTVLDSCPHCCKKHSEDDAHKTTDNGIYCVIEK